jgi:hypothetical protein
VDSELSNDGILMIKLLIVCRTEIADRRVQATLYALQEGITSLEKSEEM